MIHLLKPLVSNVVTGIQNDQTNILWKILFNFLTNELICKFMMVYYTSYVTQKIHIYLRIFIAICKADIWTFELCRWWWWESSHKTHLLVLSFYLIRKFVQYDIIILHNNFYQEKHVMRLYLGYQMLLCSS